MRTVPAISLALLLAATGCSSSSEAAAEADATAACGEYASYVAANFAKESGTAEILERAMVLAGNAAEADPTYAPIVSGLDARRQAGEDLRAAVDGDASDKEGVDGAIELMASANDTIVTACADLDITITPTG